MKNICFLVLLLSLANGENLLHNPGFEVGGNQPDGWDLVTWGTAGKVLWGAEHGYEKTLGVQLASPSDKDRVSVAQIVPVEGLPALRVRLRARSENLAAGKALVRVTFLKERKDKSGSDAKVAMKTDATWKQITTGFLLPEGTSFLRLDIFVMYGQGRLWVDDVEIEEADPADSTLFVNRGPLTATQAEKERAKAGLDARLGPIRSRTLALFASNELRSPATFRMALGSIHERADKFLAEPLRPVDMTTVVGRPYGNYNMDVWRLKTMADSLLALAQCVYIPKTPMTGKAEVVKRIQETFSLLADHFQSDGSTHAPDANIDRFLLIPISEAYSLAWPDLPPALRDRVADLLVSAAYFQFHGYGKREAVGTYPNMDAAYLQIMQFAGMAFGESKFLQEARTTVGQLKACMTGGTWDYIKNWNADPRYTRIVLEGVGRYWQMSDDPEALKQIQAHGAWLKYFLEPGGLMDFGSAPFIKHDWHYVPYSAIGHGLDLIALARPDADIQGHLARMRSFAAGRPGILSSPFQIYWTASEQGPTNGPMGSFVRVAPEIDGLQGRTTDPQGSLTHYLNGRNIAVDTRVSSIYSPADPKEPSTVFAGLFVEIIQNDAIYFIGDMAPEISRNSNRGLTFQQRRHALGPQVEPMPFGGHLGSIKNWKHNCWKGGSPDTPPMKTVESWRLDETSGLLRGDISVKAEAAVTLEAVRLSTWLAPGALDEVVIDGKTLFQRRGRLCVAVQSTLGTWMPVVEKTLFHFKADLPADDYRITVVSGDGQFNTEPFDLVANENPIPGSLSAAKGEFARKTFDLRVGDGSLRLLFLPKSPGEHWKINAISIESKRGPFSRHWDVGLATWPPASGHERLSGSTVHGGTNAVGWFKDLGRQERDRGVGDGPERTLITCGDGVETRTRFSESRTREWAAGEEAKATVTVGMAADIRGFRRLLGLSDREKGP